MIIDKALFGECFCCVCDNYNEVLNYYKKHASKEDIKETFNNWKQD